MDKTSARQWVDPAQFHAVEAGLRVVAAWSRATCDADVALEGALRQEPDQADVLVGLATVTRLLAMELAVVTASSETEVLAQLDARVHRLQAGAR